MASEPVTVWVATDENRDQYIFCSKPEWHKTLWNSDDTYEQLPDEIGISVAPGECVEYVMLTADQYRSQQRQKPAELSPVARLIAELAHSRHIDPDAPSMRDCLLLATETVKTAIAAAREIESEGK
jgi:hypothetical protein